jgi:hypothetical protein
MDTIEYKCHICGKIFQSKRNLKYHIDNKSCRACNFECKLCKKQFTTATNMYRHMRSACDVKKSEDIRRDKIYERLLELEEKTKKIDMLEKENNKLKKKVVSLEKNAIKVSKTVNNNIINNNTKNINNGIVTNINLIGYGKEDLSKIDKNEILRAIQSGFDSTIKLTETMHFNPKHPEYHNVYITNVKNKYAMMFDGSDWNLTMKDELINKIYVDKKNYIEENLDKFIDSLSLSRKKALERWIATDDDDNRINKIKNEIKLLLYNKRNLITDKQEDLMIKLKK